ncbi:LuxR C-terminal-related transcriptional regulator [Hyphomicrobium sp. CS1BSMeth3]|uniref:LuxR C-terminal-related transcriptional regulator n=1 Tax=Hyphomicrobium sp. CS1BSMeth3 TaxID=1892844 RepID=UPI0009FA3FBE|nr:LuxR C-terminal-related transcriptional regulator [Hyphomicrobium sp. CS1BSMeth3]
MSLDIVAVLSGTAEVLPASAPPLGYCAGEDRNTPKRTSGSRYSATLSADAAAAQHCHLCEALHDMASAYGARGGIYVHFGHAIHTPETEEIVPARFVASSATDRRFFFQEGSLSLDQVARRAMRAHTPFTWSSSCDTGTSPAELSLGGRLRARAIQGGIAIPVQDYAAGPAFINLYYNAFVSAAEAQEIVTSRAPELSYAAAYFHQRAKDEIVSDIGDGTLPALTLREVESLRLAALGKTVNEIAEFLEVKPRTIEFHLKNAAEKLGAPNKLRAVVVAMRCGLIEA